MELKDFEQALARLEEIVNKLEQGELALEEALQLFEEGMNISRFCGERLDEAQRKVEMLVKSSQKELEAKPFVVRDEETAGNG
jgi:exodeoxyribonuclease VII small subunit